MEGVGVGKDGGEMTLQQFMDYFSEKHQLSINMLSFDVALMYSFFMNKDKVKARMAKPWVGNDWNLLSLFYCFALPPLSPELFIWA